jgi:type IX secretion system PorP/SprF family membrane protein
MFYQPQVNFASSVGYNNGVSGFASSRNQWVGFDGAPKTYGAQVVMPLTELNSSIGIRFGRDEIGVNTRDLISIGYSYRVKLTEGLVMGISLSPQFRLLQSKRAELVANDIQDPYLSSNVKNQMAPNSEFGAYLFSNKFYVGFALPGLLVNDITTAGKVNTYADFGKLTYLLHGGYQLDLKSGKLNFSTLIKSSYGSSVHIEINTMYTFLEDKLGLGLAFRTSKDLLGLVRFNVNKVFSIGYAYQYTYSGLSNYQNGSHEVMMIYELSSNKEFVKLNAPRF